jgi:hypothetical protein
MLTALLVQEGALSTGDEHTALQEHRATGKPVEEILVETGKLNETDLVSVLSRRCKVPHLSLERTQINDDVVALVPLDFARANRIVPLQKLGKLLNVATSNPLDMGTFRRLQELTGLRVKPMLATPSELKECLDKHYPAPPEEAVTETKKADVKITVKDFLKESWLGAVGPAEDSSSALAAVSPEPESLSAQEAEAAPASPDDSRAIPLSDDDVRAFQKASAAGLYKDWTRSIAYGSEDLGPAPSISDVEFALLAADAPLPKEDPTATKSGSGSSTRGSRAARKKKRKKRRSSR